MLGRPIFPIEVDRKAAAPWSPKNIDLIALFAILTVLFALLIWGRYRYDIVALGALVIAVVAGIVPSASAFEGFGHPATIIIALVLVVSRGLANSGAVDLVARVFRAGRPRCLQPTSA